MAPKRIDPRLESLIVRLRDDEKLTFDNIAAHLKMSRTGVRKSYYRSKHPKTVNKGGRPRCTDIRSAK